MLCEIFCFVCKPPTTPDFLTFLNITRRSPKTQSSQNFPLRRRRRRHDAHNSTPGGHAKDCQEIREIGANPLGFDCKMLAEQHQIQLITFAARALACPRSDEVI